MGSSYYSWEYLDPEEEEEEKEEEEEEEEGSKLIRNITNDSQIDTAA